MMNRSFALNCFARCLSPWRAAVVGGMLVLSGCGLTTEPTRLDCAIDRTATIRSDGSISSSAQAGLVQIGDNSDNVQLRAVVSVSLRNIPAGANVTKVILRLTGNSVLGSPFVDFNAMDVSSIETVSSLGIGDFFSDGTKVGAITSLPGAGAPPQSVDIDVTAAVKGDLAAGRPISSFRLSFLEAPTADAQSDMVTVQADSNDPNAQPFALATIAQ